MNFPFGKSSFNTIRACIHQQIRPWWPLSRLKYTFSLNSLQLRVTSCISPIQPSPIIINNNWIPFGFRFRFEINQPHFCHTMKCFCLVDVLIHFMCLYYSSSIENTEEKNTLKNKMLWELSINFELQFYFSKQMHCADITIYESSSIDFVNVGERWI